jgi:hypothetical protein
MSSNWPKPGINFTPAYQISGIPFVTSSADDELTSSGNVVKIEFPFVTSTIRVECSGSVSGDGTTGTIRFGFSENGVKATENANYFICASAGGISYASPELPIRCKEIFLRYDTFSGGRSAIGFNVSAGLTNIPSGSLDNMTGSIEVDGAKVLQPIYRGVG